MVAFSMIDVWRIIVMRINDLFKDRYYEINKESVMINEFLGKEDDAPYQKIVSAIYLHNSGNEMYILLDCRSIEVSKWVEVIDHWELNILTFVNNNKQFNQKGKMYFLKYNITVIILCDKTIDKTKYQVIYELEKSQKICRKIIVGIDQQFQPDEAELDLFPFYFEDLVEINTNQEDSLHDEISIILNRNISLDKYVNAGVYDEKTLSEIRRIFGGDSNAR